MLDKHTPGPWSVGSGSRILSHGPIVIAETWPTHPDAAANRANCRLVAAAPELLAACEAFVEAWEKCLQLEKTDVALQMAKAAIAKVKGEDNVG